MNPAEYYRCRRKRVHLDYLSALRHAVRLDRNDSVVIFPCRFCGGLHVGHQNRRPRPARKKKSGLKGKSVKSRIAKTKLKISRELKRIERRRDFLGPRTLIISRQRLQSLHQYLSTLEADQLRCQHRGGPDSAGQVSAVEGSFETAHPPFSVTSTHRDKSEPK